jgi:drug/metabolite transporter (DMT)-like permease
MSSRSVTIKGFSFALLAGLCWGVGGTFAQFLFQKRGINPEWLVTARLLTAGVLLLLISIVKKEASVTAIWKSGKDVLALVVFSILGMLAVQYTFFVTINYTNAATATIIQFLGPVMIVIYTAWVSKRLPSGWQLFAVVLAVAGTVMLVTHGRWSSI